LKINVSPAAAAWVLHRSAAVAARPNGGNPVRVRTFQGYDLRTFNGRIELARGTYKDDSKVSSAQRRLYDLIGEDQVVWCVQGQLLGEEIGRYHHEIDADSRDMVAVVDALVWCHIAQYRPRYIPPEDRCVLNIQAATSGVDDRDAALRKAEDDYLAANLPADLWAAVTKKGITKKSDQLLVKFPFEFSTILNVEVVSEETAKGERRGRTAK